MKKGLGRGLEALFELNDENASIESGTIQTLRISDIEPDKGQPRKSFDEEKLSELAASIKAHGIIQPIVVRMLDNGRYSIIAGERRWRAARRAGISEVPVVVKEYSEREAREIALVENLQREDLNPVEEAFGYKTLMDAYELTQEEIASIVGKSRPVVANALRILNLPPNILKMVENNDISAGHARALLSLKEEDIEKTAKRIVNEDLTVRDIEKLSKAKEKVTKGSQITIASSALLELEAQIAESLGRKVKIINKQNKGKIELEYYSNDDLDHLIGFLLK
jgi:ParB family chromosome partitioning protein